MSKPETRLRENIHKHLPKGAFLQGNGAGGFTSNGVPDVYYDGPRGDLWVEYKQVQSVPRSGIVIGAYTALQHKWLDRRFANGRNAIGIVGIPGRLVCLQLTPAERRGGTSVDSAINYKEAAEYIAQFCGMNLDDTRRLRRRKEREQSSPRQSSRPQREQPASGGASFDDETIPF